MIHRIVNFSHKYFEPKKKPVKTSNAIIAMNLWINEFSIPRKRATLSPKPMTTNAIATD